MKKIIIILILFLINIINIKALDNTIVVGEWQTQKLEGENVKLVATERRYKWYKEQKVYGPDYYTTLDDLTNYPIKDEQNYIEPPFTAWDHMVIPANIEGRTIEERSVRKYHEIRPVRYLFFEEITGGFTTFNISELNILIDGNEIPYDLQCEGCSFDFNNYVTNNNIDDRNVYVSNGGHFRIDLRGYYSIGQIRIELYMYDDVPNTKRCMIYMNEGDTLEDRNYARSEFANYVVSQSIIPERHLIMPSASWIVNPVYGDWIYIEGSVNTTFYREMTIAVERRYKDIKYRYYRMERVYLEGYNITVADTNYQKDDLQYQDFYKYQIIKPTIKEETIKPVIVKTEPTVKIIKQPIIETKNDNKTALKVLDKAKQIESTITKLITINAIIWSLIILLLILLVIKQQKLSHQKNF